MFNRNIVQSTFRLIVGLYYIELFKNHYLQMFICKKEIER